MIKDEQVHNYKISNVLNVSKGWQWIQLALKKLIWQKCVDWIISYLFPDLLWLSNNLTFKKNFDFFFLFLLKILKNITDIDGWIIGIFF